MPKLSIIVPIYKVEKYLSQCVKSILSQEYENFELILVDDGSPDSCPQICDDFAKEDKRITVVHKKNGGLVSARQAGFLASSGEYIGFVDGDDFIESDFYSKMMQHAQKNDADIVIASHKEDFGNLINEKITNAKDGIYKDENLKKLKQTMLYNGTFYEQDIFPCVWAKIYRREIIQNHINNIPQQITMGEDCAITYPCVLDAKIIVVDNTICSYHYRINDASMTHTFDIKYFYRINFLFDYLNEIFQKSQIENVYNQFYYYKLFIILYGVNSLINCKNIFVFKKILEIKKELKVNNIKDLISKIDFTGFSKAQQKEVRLLQIPFLFVVRNYSSRVFHKIKHMIKSKS